MNVSKVLSAAACSAGLMMGGGLFVTEAQAAPDGFYGGVGIATQVPSYNSELTVDNKPCNTAQDSGRIVDACFEVATVGRAYLGWENVMENFGHVAYYAEAGFNNNFDSGRNYADVKLGFNIPLNEDVTLLANGAYNRYGAGRVSTNVQLEVDF